MKTSEKIVRKGDYYEFEFVEDISATTRPLKKEESTVAGQSSEFISNELPSFEAARQEYYYQRKNIYHEKSLDQLREELNIILEENGLKDQEKSEAYKMLKEIQTLKQQNIVPLNNWESAKIKTGKVGVSMDRISLSAPLQTAELQQEIKKLELCNYNQLSKLEHILEMMLGQKKIPAAVPPLQVGERFKEEVDGLYNHLNSLACLSDLSGIAERICANDGKYVQIAAWSKNVNAVSNINADFLAQLQEDSRLLDKLEQSFDSNLEYVHSLLKTVKSTKATKNK